MKRSPVNVDMRISQTGLELIKTFEWFAPESYQCSSGIWTIGYGHTSAAGLPEVREGMRMTEPQAVNQLHIDMKQYEDAVKRLVKVPLFQHQYDSLVSFTFNCGEGSLKSSTMLKRINKEEESERITEAMSWWNKSGGKVSVGLVRRRKSEGHLFLTGQLEFYE